MATVTVSSEPRFGRPGIALARAVRTSRGWRRPRTLAPPSDVFSAGRELIASGELQHHLWVSLGRVVKGLSLGVAAGTVLALLAGLSRLGEDVIDPPVQMIRTVPVLALTP